MKRIICIFIMSMIVFSVFSQEKIRYGNIPYGISFEEALTSYGSLYDVVSYDVRSMGTYVFSSFTNSFTALRPMFKNIGTDFDEDLTRVIRLTDNKSNPSYFDRTYLYFINNNGQTKLFMVERRSTSGSGAFGGWANSRLNAVETYRENKAVITEIMKLNPRELQGRYEYYDSSSRRNTSSDAYVAIWEKSNERVILRVSSEGSGMFLSLQGGFTYISIPLFNEYENLVVTKHTQQENARRESAKQSARGDF